MQHGTNPKRHVMLAAGLALAAGALGLVASGGAAAATTAGATARPASETRPDSAQPLAVRGPYFSTFYAGYSALFAPAGQTFRVTSTEFKVPALNCSVTRAPSYVYQMATIGGLNEYYGPSGGAGVAEYCNGGAHYYAMRWVNGVLQRGFAVKPGDVIEAIVNDLGTKYDLTADDLSEHKAFAADEKCGGTCNNNSAGVISYGTSSPPWSGPADFGTVKFADIRISLTHGAAGNFGSSTWEDFLTYESQASVDDMKPAALVDGGSEFTIKWLSDH